MTMTDQAPREPSMPKIRIDEFSDRVLREFVAGMSEQERRMWGQIIFQRKVENQAHKERNRDAAYWFLMGWPVGGAISAVLMWAFLVFPMFMALMGVG